MAQSEGRANESETVIVYATFPTIEAAKTAARGLVEARLVACVNVIPGMLAIYEWQGALHEDAEVVAIAKTTAARVPEVIATVTSGHPYENPAIVAVPIVAGSADYLAWVAACTRD